jgi:dTDP-4-amino-4,6-dideoxygalactose transaminase
MYQPVGIRYRVNVLYLSDPTRYAEQKRSELHAVVDRLVDGKQLVLGRMVSQFEESFATYIGTNHCISVASGTDAIEIALRALGCEGKEVLVVANAGGYGTISCLAIGAIPVYCDIDPATLLVSVGSIVAGVTNDTAAILVTHLFGLALDCTLVDAAVKAKLGKSIPIVEDCAQAHGSKVGNLRAGAQATIGCFSFYPTKNLGALGDGGAIVTSDAALAEHMRNLRQYGWTNRYLQERPGGRNSRLDELQAGFLSVFLPHLDERNAKRRAILKRYVASGASAIHAVYVDSDQCVAHLAVCTVNNRNEFIAQLTADNVSTGVHYPYLDTEFPTTKHLAPSHLPVSEMAKNRIVTLPCFPEMTQSEIDSVCRTIEKNNQFFEAP